MYILEIENLISTLHESQNSLVEILKQDADYCALMEIPSCKDAVKPYDRIRGANLRAKLELKYGGQTFQKVRTKFDDALQQFEHELNLMAQTRIVPDREDEKVFVEKRETSLDGNAICREAAEKAIALAVKSNSQISQCSADMIAEDAPSVEETCPINISKPDFSSSRNIIRFPVEPFKVSRNLPSEDKDMEEDKDMDEEQYFPIPREATGFSRLIASSIIALLAIFAIGAAIPASATASKQLLRSMLPVSSDWQG